MILDARLTFAEHRKKIEDKCKKVIHVMRCLTGREWGASCSSLKSIYVALIRSVLDYVSIVVGSAVESLLMRLDVIQNQALRICCGAFKTSSIPAIQVEMGELPLELRRIQLMANYWAGLQGHNVKEVNLYRFIQMVLKDQRLKRPGLGWQFQGKK